MYVLPSLELLLTPQCLGWKVTPEGDWVEGVPAALRLATWVRGYLQGQELMAERKRLVVSGEWHPHIHENCCREGKGKRSL